MEEKVQKGKINRTVIMICGMLLGVLLIAFGVHYNINSEYSKLNLPTPEKIQSEINVAYQDINNLRKEMLDEYDKNGQTASYMDMSRKIQEKEAERANLEERLLKMNNHEYDGIKNETISRSLPFFVSGVVIILASLMISGVLFSIQQNQIKKL